MTTRKHEIKSAWVLSLCPLVLQVTYKPGGTDTFTPLQMDGELTPAAEKKARKLAGLE